MGELKSPALAAFLSSMTMFYHRKSEKAAVLFLTNY